MNRMDTDDEAGWEEVLSDQSQEIGDWGLEI